MNTIAKFIPIVVIGSLIITLSCKDTPRSVEKYEETVADTLKSTREFGDKVTLQRLQQAVTTYRLTKGRFPGNLHELGNFVGETVDSNKYDYDPSSGKLDPR